MALGQDPNGGTLEELGIVSSSEGTGSVSLVDDPEEAGNAVLQLFDSVGNPVRADLPFDVPDERFLPGDMLIAGDVVLDFRYRVDQAAIDNDTILEIYIDETPVIDIELQSGDVTLAGNGELLDNTSIVPDAWLPGDMLSVGFRTKGGGDPLVLVDDVSMLMPFTDIPVPAAAPAPAPLPLLMGGLVALLVAGRRRREPGRAVR